MSRRIGAIAILGLICSAPATVRAASILIDGSISDWSSITAIPLVEPERRHDSPLGKIQYMKVTTDDDFLFVLIGFEQPRPTRSKRGERVRPPTMWDDYSYFELDVDGDGAWDYRTRMVNGKRIGLNNLLVLESTGPGAPGRVVLSPEGRKDYLPLGPRAFFLLGRGGVEQRLPRGPLQLIEGRVFLRAMVRYRDSARGSGRWVSEFFPSGGRWIGLDLKRPADSDALAGRATTVNRMIEPSMNRDDLGPRRDVDSKRLRSTLVYPRPTPPPFIPRAGRAAQAEGARPKATQSTPALVIDASGEVVSPQVPTATPPAPELSASPSDEPSLPRERPNCEPSEAPPEGASHPADDADESSGSSQDPATPPRA